jgi:hypothetical protein
MVITPPWQSKMSQVELVKVDYRSVSPSEYDINLTASFDKYLTLQSHVYLLLSSVAIGDFDTLVNNYRNILPQKLLKNSFMLLLVRVWIMVVFRCLACLSTRYRYLSASIILKTAAKSHSYHSM